MPHLKRPASAKCHLYEYSTYTLKDVKRLLPQVLNEQVAAIHVTAE